VLKTIRKAAAQSNESGPVLAALRAGIEPARLTRELAAQHPGDAGFARRLVDAASARLWLDDGAPAADIITMLEVRHRFELSPANARAYAVEILSAVEHTTEALNPHSIPPAKETRYAAA